MRRAPRVPVVRNLGRAPPTQWRRCLCLLSYLFSWSKSSSAFSLCRKHSRSRRYNSTIQNCFFVASYTVILVYSKETVHPTLSCFPCLASSCLAFHILQFGPSISCPALLSPGILTVRHFQVMHFQSTHWSER